MQLFEATVARNPSRREQRSSSISHRDGGIHNGGDLRMMAMIFSDTLAGEFNCALHVYTFCVDHSHSLAPLATFGALVRHEVPAR